MNELYFIRRKRGNYLTLRIEFGKVKSKSLLRFTEGEIKPLSKYESYPSETLYQNEEDMLKKISEMREKLSEDRWMLKPKGLNRNMSIEH